MKPMPPCIKNGVRCVRREQGCQQRCPEFSDFRKGLDEYNVARRESQKKETLATTDRRKKQKIQNMKLGKGGRKK